MINPIRSIAGSCYKVQDLAENVSTFIAEQVYYVISTCEMAEHEPVALLHEASRTNNLLLCVYIYVLLVVRSIGSVDIWRFIRLH